MIKLTLTVESGPTAGKRFSLETGSLELGRGDDCHVRFETSQVQVSRRHATILREGSCFRLTDHSSNGTSVNGQRMATAALQTGDLLRLGSDGPLVRVLVESDAADAPTMRSGAVTTVPTPAPRHVPTPAPPRVAAPKVAPPVPDRPIHRPVPRPSAIADSGLYHPERDKGRRPGVLGILVVLAMLIGGAGFGMLVILMTILELGGHAFIGAAVAFAVAPIYLAIWLWLDRYDPEPVWIQAGALVWGAGAATFVSGILNTLFGQIVYGLTQSKGAAMLLSASISAPVVEEALKGLAVLLIFLALRREFDGVIDGIAYAGIVALGFATVENVLYYGRVVAKEGAPGLLLVFFMRGVLGPFGHAVFTSMTGIGCGIARQTHNTFLRLTMPLVGYGAAILLHFLWNTLAAFSGSPAGFMVIYVIIWLPLFLVFFAVVIWMGFREARLIRHMLDLEVARGLLTKDQADLVASWPRRIGWLLGSLGDLRRFRARHDFLHAATRLALCYWHVSRAQAAGGHTVSFGQIPLFQREIEGLRAAI